MRAYFGEPEGEKCGLCDSCAGLDSEVFDPGSDDARHGLHAATDFHARPRRRRRRGGEEQPQQQLRHGQMRAGQRPQPGSRRISVPCPQRRCSRPRSRRTCCRRCRWRSPPLADEAESTFDRVASGAAWTPRRRAHWPPLAGEPVVEDLDAWLARGRGRRGRPRSVVAQRQCDQRRRGWRPTGSPGWRAGRNCPRHAGMASPTRSESTSARAGDAVSSAEQIGRRRARPAAIRSRPGGRQCATPTSGPTPSGVPARPSRCRSIARPAGGLDRRHGGQGAPAAATAVAAMDRAARGGNGGGTTRGPSGAAGGGGNGHGGGGGATATIATADGGDRGGGKRPRPRNRGGARARRAQTGERGPRLPGFYNPGGGLDRPSAVSALAARYQATKRGMPSLDGDARRIAELRVRTASRRPACASCRPAARAARSISGVGARRAARSAPPARISVVVCEPPRL